MSEWTPPSLTPPKKRHQTRAISRQNKKDCRIAPRNIHGTSPRIPTCRTRVREWWIRPNSKARSILRGNKVSLVVSSPFFFSSFLFVLFFLFISSPLLAGRSMYPSLLRECHHYYLSSFDPCLPFPFPSLPSRSDKGSMDHGSY